MSEFPDAKTCPRCGAVNVVADLPGHGYRCSGCGLEQAHLDVAANGAVRGVFGWILQPGDLVAERYRIKAVLGKGGFGVTYLVEDERVHGKKRALKEIPEILFDEHETRLLGRLRHPAIPDITDRLTDGGMIYLVLEFGGSRTLRTEQECHGGRIPFGVLVPWMEEICSALSYLHAQDPPVVHRDLKPENVLLDDSGRVMLIDFGIAKESAPETVTRTLGRAVTHGYSPPEQVLGTGTDARSDVYALGAILYSMITGQVPTPAHERVVGKPLPAPSELVSEIPPLLEATILQSLELNINFRQQSIEDFARVLALVRGSGEGGRTVLVSDTQAVAAQLSTSSGEVRLSSVQLSTTGRTTGQPPPLQVRATPTKTPLAPVPGHRGGFGAGAAALIVVLTAGGAGWWWLQRESPAPALVGPPSPTEDSSGTAATAASPPAPAGTAVGRPADVAASVPSGVGAGSPALPGSVAAPPSSERDAAPVAYPVPEPSPVAKQSPLAEPPTAEAQVASPRSAGGASAGVPKPRTATVGAAAPPPAAEPGEGSLTSPALPTWQPVQTTEPTAVSLMDDFNKRRQEVLAEEPTVPVLPPAGPPRGPEPGPQQSPKAPVKTVKAQDERPKHVSPPPDNPFAGMQMRDRKTTRTD